MFKLQRISNNQNNSNNILICDNENGKLISDMNFKNNELLIVQKKKPASIPYANLLDDKTGEFNDKAKIVFLNIF